MICPKCGKEVADDAAFCASCGVSLKEQHSTSSASREVRYVSPAHKSEYDDSKEGLGVVMALFLGLIGLIIGVCLYPSGTNARKTFMHGWLLTYGIAFGIVIIIGIIAAMP